MPDSRKYRVLAGGSKADVEAAGKAVTTITISAGQGMGVCCKSKPKVGGFTWDVHATITKMDKLKNGRREIGETVKEFHVSAKCDGYTARACWKYGSSSWSTDGWDRRLKISNIPFGTGDDKEEKKLQKELLAKINDCAAKLGKAFSGGSMSKFSI